MMLTGKVQSTLRKVHTVAQLFEHHATSWKVAVLIRNGIIEMFH